MKRLLILLLVLGTVIPAAMDQASPGASMPTLNDYDPKPTCTGSLQARIDKAAPGDIVKANPDCIYREEIVIKTSITLDGLGEAEIRGSDVWEEWTERDGLWVSANEAPLTGSLGTCDVNSDGRCLWPEQVFMDGIALRQVRAGSQPGPGQFSLNSQRRVVLADDPEGVIVEVSVRKRWLNIQADSVIVQGFAMEHASTDPQYGAVQIDGASNWLVQDNVLSDAHGVIVMFQNTNHGQMLNSDLFNAGQLGFGGHESHNILVRGNSIHHNNTEEFSTGWESGGGKITASHGSVVDNNRIFMNDGPGFWCDGDCIDTTISNNRVYSNLGIGLFFEISDSAEIFGNKVWNNGWGPVQVGWAYDAGILVSSSRNAHVHDNVVAWNGDGVTVISQCRKFLEDGVTCDLTHRWNRVIGNEVYRNTIVLGESAQSDTQPYALAWLSDIANGEDGFEDQMFDPDAGNRGYNNRYWIPQPEGSTDIRFSWDNEYPSDLSAFNNTPGEEHGVYLDCKERDRILKASGVPLEPEDHTVQVPLPTPFAAEMCPIQAYPWP